MKKMMLVLFTALLVMCSYSSDAMNYSLNETEQTVKEKIEVYYFHFTRRCMTCNRVEKEAKEALETLYPEQLKSGLVSFVEVNLDDEGSKAAVEKTKANGQGLIIVSGEKRTDLTRTGFMYAVSNPERLKDEIKKAIDPMLASK